MPSARPCWGCQRLAETLARRLQLALEELIIGFRGQLDVADGGERIATETSEDVADTPEGEGQNQNAEQDLGDPAAGAFAE